MASSKRRKIIAINACLKKEELEQPNFTHQQARKRRAN